MPPDTAVVTGAARGIGLEVARQLARDHGYRVILTAREPHKAAVAAEQLSNDGEVIPATLDIADDASTMKFAQRMRDEFQSLDVLVNNAAVDYDTDQRAIHADLGRVRRDLETNLFGAWRVTQALLSLLRQSRNGRIVNVSSGAGQITGLRGGTPAYTISKLSLNGLTLMLADELKQDGIKVNAVCPGWVATDMGGPGGRPISEGAESVVWAATLDKTGPTGGFFRDGEPIPW